MRAARMHGYNQPLVLEDIPVPAIVFAPEISWGALSSNISAPLPLTTLRAPLGA